MIEMEILFDSAVDRFFVVGVEDDCTPTKEPLDEMILAEIAVYHEKRAEMVRELKRILQMAEEVK